MPKANPIREMSNALIQIRKTRSLTQAQAAELAKMGRSLWSAFETKKRPLSVALLNRIQIGLNLSDEEVMYILRWWGDAHCSVDPDKHTHAALLRAEKALKKKRRSRKKTSAEDAGATHEEEK